MSSDGRHFLLLLVWVDAMANITVYSSQQTEEVVFGTPALIQTFRNIEGKTWARNKKVASKITASLLCSLPTHAQLLLHPPTNRDNIPPSCRTLTLS